MPIRFLRRLLRSTTTQRPAKRGPGARPSIESTRPPPPASPANDLQRLPGIGPTIAQRLNAAGFTTLDDLRSAGDDQLQAVPGVGVTIIARIRQHLEGQVDLPPKRTPVPLDNHAQPPPSLNAGARHERGMSELMGLIRGVIADGEVSEAEVVVLRDWIAANPDVSSEWPANLLARRLDRIFEDGIVTEEERRDLAALLEEFTGGGAGVGGGFTRTTTLPLDDPQPEIEFRGRTFVLTGTFAYGPRRVCEEAIERLGGTCERRVTRRTDYLVIGTAGSRDWIESTHGRKILQAVEYRERGQTLAIVSEDHWAARVDQYNN